MKKFTAMALAIMMIISCCPVSVLAEETTEAATQTEVAEIEETAAESVQEEETETALPMEEEPAVEEAAEDQITETDGTSIVDEIMPLLENNSGVVSSGTCGTNVTYTLYRDGELVISGMGAMTNYNYAGAPWYSNHDSIKTVAIESGVTSIGDWTFSYCSSLTSITIPDSVTSIGVDAFSYCSSLTGVYISDIAAWCKISFSGSSPNPLYYAHNLYLNGEPITELTIPDSVTSIGCWAFYGCSSLTSITIGDGVTSIGDHAFSGCSSLTSITIPDSVTNISYLAFYNCSSLTSITIGDSVTIIGDSAFYGTAYYDDSDNWVDGVLYIGNYLIKAQNSISGNYSIREGTLCIGSDAFHGCSSLTSITIPDSVTSIGSDAFHGCSSLTSITIPDSVTGIGDYAFYCAFYNCSSLTSITIGDGVTSIGYSAFENCRSLSSITIPDSVTSIGGWAFKNCSSLTSITIPDSVTSIGSDAFHGCSSLTSITIPDSVTSIGDSAFYGTAYYDDSDNWVDGVLYIGNYLIKAQNSISGNYSIREGTLCIGDRAFENCSSLTSITIPDSVTSIGSNAFYNCSSLTSITIGDSVTSIGYYAFYNCRSLTSITIPDSVTSIVICAFRGCSGLTSITIPDSVTSIGDYAFYNCNNLKQILYYGTKEQYQSLSMGTDVFSSSPAIHYIQVDVPAVAVTCTTDGMVEGSHCTECGKIISVAEVIPALGHDYAVDKRIEPTCTRAGKTQGYSCHRCGEIFIAQETIPALNPEGGHTTVTDIAVAPTCTEEGFTEGSHCSRCGEIFVSQQVISATDHNYGIAKFTWATDGKSATAMRICANDNSHTLSGDATITSTIKTAPTCTKMGSTTYTAKITLGGVEYTDTLDVLDIPALGHATVTDTAIAPTCTTDGCTEGSHCSRCSKVLVAQQIIPALGHATVTDIAVAATCTKTGLTEGCHCSRCKEVLVAQQVVPKKEHSYYTTSRTEPTCTESGREGGALACSVCKQVFIADNEIPALGHDWNVATYEWAADGSTCTAKRVCQNDENHVETANASITSEVAKAATRTTNGDTTYTATFTESWASRQTKTVVGNIPALRINIALSGTVTNGSGGQAALYKATNLISITKIENDTFNINITGLGDYTLRFTRTGYVTRTVPLSVTEGSSEQQSVSAMLVKIGDITGAKSAQADTLNVADLQALYEHLCGAKRLTDDYALTVADVNGDSAVNILDYQALYEMVKK